jgi:ABC-type antimicrobial peptide transport system permease subunit
MESHPGFCIEEDMSKDHRYTEPPRFAQRILHWYCRKDLVEDLQGDLNEYFERHIRTKGLRRARLIYYMDVLKFCRLYTIRKPELINLLTQSIMITSYIKTSGRSILRSKLFSSINIIGLAISMSVGLLIIAALFDVFSYDKFHEHHDRIYRVISKYYYNGNPDREFYATTSMKAAKTIQESMTGVEDVAILRRGFSGDITTHDKTIPLNGFWANSSLFKVFSFQLLEGNPSTALSSPFSVILTETSAHKLFGNAPPLGKSVVLNKDRAYTVTGVMRDTPKQSHITFDMLASLASFEVLQKDNANELAWNNVWNTWAYVLMPEKADLHAFQSKLDKLSQVEDKTVPLTHIQLALQPLDNIMTSESMNNSIGPTMGSTTVWILSSLAVVVVLSACFNYTNLSVARSFRRSREVGIRKTIGALKTQVISQFIVESVVLSFIALIVAFLLFLTIRPHFISLEPELQKILSLELSPALIGLFILFALVVGIAAGFFPAIFFAKINAIESLKNLIAIPSFKGVTIRKGLIVVQYTLSVIFITSTLIIYKQYRHYVNFDLGFSTENILNISLQGNHPDLLKKALSELPEVKDISESSIVMSIGNYYGMHVKNPNDPSDSAVVNYNTVDEHYLPLHEFKLLAGHNFSTHAGDFEQNEVIINERLLKRFNIGGGHPAEAIDEVIEANGKDLKIVGVMKNFQYGQANYRSDYEVALLYNNKKAEYLNVKILSDDILGTHAKIEKIWKSLDLVHPLEAHFYDDQIEASFSGLKASVKVAGFLGSLVIFIALMGLLGMVIFTTETRLKEISIRKVLGASEAKLLILLGKSFFILLILASAIGLATTYFFFTQIVFRELQNHAPLGAFELLAGVVAISSVAIIVIGTQARKIAYANPAEVLKSE